MNSRLLRTVGEHLEFPWLGPQRDTKMTPQDIIGFRLSKFVQISEIFQIYITDLG